jgi:hypothetical protein
MICKCLEFRLISNFIFIAKAIGIKFDEKLGFNLLAKEFVRQAGDLPRD